MHGGEAGRADFNMGSLTISEATAFEGIVHYAPQALRALST